MTIVKKSMTEHDETYQKTTLPNGVRVVTERIAHVRSVSLGLWVGIGPFNFQPGEAAKVLLVVFFAAVIG